MTPEPETFAVDPARLSDGEWCHRVQKTICQGDIAASYSAERIGMNQPLRKPFTWKGALWVCVGRTFRNGCQSAEVYRLAHPQAFDGEPVTYSSPLMSILHTHNPSALRKLKPRTPSSQYVKFSMPTGA